MLLSIVISVYRVDEYIEKCILSILDAELFDYEILLVLRDVDNSESEEICKKYANTCKNIKIIRQKGIGLSDARNCGLQEANGDYIIFVDGDDFVLSQELFEFEKQLQNLDKMKPDMIVSDFHMVDENGEIVYTQNQIEQTGTDIVHDDNYTLTYLKSNGSIWNVWRYTYARKFLEKNRRKFLENYLCEDVDFTVRSFWLTDKIYYYHNPFYCYCYNREESLFNHRNVNYVINLLEISEQLLWEMGKIEDSRNKAIKQKLLREIILGIVSVVEMDEESKKGAIAEYEKKLYILRVREFKIRIVYIVIKLIGLKAFSNLLYLIKIIRRKVLYD